MRYHYAKWLYELYFSLHCQLKFIIELLIKIKFEIGRIHRHKLFIVYDTLYCFIVNSLELTSQMREQDEDIKQMKRQNVEKYLFTTVWTADIKPTQQLTKRVLSRMHY